MDWDTAEWVGMGTMGWREMDTAGWKGMDAKGWTQRDKLGYSGMGTGINIESDFLIFT